MGVGPIPRHAIRDMAIENDLDTDEAETFRIIIRALDREYIAKNTPGDTDNRGHRTVAIDDVQGVSELFRRHAKTDPTPD